jgi:hypothetical protein
MVGLASSVSGGCPCAGFLLRLSTAELGSLKVSGQVPSWEDTSSDHRGQAALHPDPEWATAAVISGLLLFFTNVLAGAASLPVAESGPKTGSARVDWESLSHQQSQISWLGFRTLKVSTASWLLGGSMSTGHLWAKHSVPTMATLTLWGLLPWMVGGR